MKSYIKFSLLGVLLCLFFCVGSWKVSFFDRDEPRFAQPAKEMLFAQNWQDWIVPHFNGEVFFHKPAFCYWQIAGAYKIFGINEFAARFLSSLWMAVSAIIIGVYLTRRFSYLTGLIGTLGFASSLMVIAEAKLATAEGTLTLLAVLAMLCLWDIFSNKAQNWQKIVFWMAIGVGILCKGPAILVPTIGTFIALLIFSKDRRWLGELGLWWGILLALVIGLPWYIAANYLSNNALIERFWQYDIVERIRQPLESHRGFPGFYVLTALIDTLPWSIFIVPVGIFAWKNRSDDKIRFLVSWLIGPTIILELIATKMVHYWILVLPAYSILLALAFTRWIENADTDEIWNRWYLPAKIALIIVWAIISASAFSVGFTNIFQSERLMFWILSTAGVLAIILVALGFNRHQPANCFMMTVFGMIIITLTISALTLPALEKYKLGKQLADNMKHLADNEKTQFGLIGWKEPSTIFYLHNGRDNIAIISPKDFSNFINLPNRIVAIKAKYAEQAFSGFKQKSSLTVGELTGYEYTRGKKQTIFIIKSPVR